MPKRVFYSLHYDDDNWRASQVRNIGTIEGNPAATPNTWESVKQAGDVAIKRWIDGNLKGKSCTVVLIGTNTAGRKWINYEIKKSWEDGKGVLGIYVHNLLNRFGQQSAMGANPFREFTLKSTGVNLADIVPAHDPPYWTSKDAYNHIAANISGWIDEAITTRSYY